MTNFDLPPDPYAVRSILVVKVGAVGDVLRTTCILPGLKSLYRNAQIYWLTHKDSIPLLISNPYVSKIYEADGSIPTSLISPDYVINLEDTKSTAHLVSKLAPRWVFGCYLDTSQSLNYTASSSKWFDMSLVSKKGIDEANLLKTHNTNTYPGILTAALNISLSRPSLFLTGKEKVASRKLKQTLFPESRKIIGINTGAGGRWRLKTLPVSSTVDLIEAIFSMSNSYVLILGGPNEEDRNKQIERQVSSKAVYIRPMPSIRNFASLVNTCDALVTSDSLCLHIGTSLSIPTVAFFGPTSSAEIELYGLGKTIQTDLACRCCYKTDCSIEANCMETFPVEELAKAVIQYI